MVKFKAVQDGVTKDVRLETWVRQDDGVWVLVDTGINLSVVELRSLADYIYSLFRSAQKKD